MPKLANFPIAKQAGPNSCWACAAREICNWYEHRKHGTGTKYISDDAFAKAWAAVEGNPTLGNISVQQSAADALAKLGHTNSADSHALPTIDEIRTQIKAQQPLLAIVGTAQPKGKRDLKCKNGHWVVIVGVSRKNKTIDVFDPDNGQVATVAYNDLTYQPSLYWQNTSYVDA